MKEILRHDCPLCSGMGTAVNYALGTYDYDQTRYRIRRIFYRCETSPCEAVFFLDSIVAQTIDPDWEEDLARCERDFEANRRELVAIDVYQRMLQAVEANDATVTKDRGLRKQVREIDHKIAEEQEKVDSFSRRMRNFSWDDPESHQRWVHENHLPPNFAEKELDIDFRMSRPSLRYDYIEDETRRGSERETIFQKGQSILHRMWGRGRVVIGNTDGGNLVTVEFPEQGQKRMDLRFSEFSKIG